jgi:hypothetical protein
VCVCLSESEKPQSGGFRSTRHNPKALQREFVQPNSRRVENGSNKRKRSQSRGRVRYEWRRRRQCCITQKNLRSRQSVREVGICVGPMYICMQTNSPGVSSESCSLMNLSVCYSERNMECIVLITLGVEFDVSASLTHKAPRAHKLGNRTSSAVVEPDSTSFGLNFRLFKRGYIDLGSKGIALVEMAPKLLTTPGVEACMIGHLCYQSITV